MEQGYWRMNDGRVIAIKDMDDRHLRKTIRLVQRVLDAIREPYFPTAEEDFTNAATPDTMRRKQEELIREAQRRGLAEKEAQE
jgi:hypothetical protein